MTTTVTPSLSSSAGYILDVRDQVATLIRFLIMNPGGTSSLWEDRLISFRTLSAEYEHDRDLFVSNLQTRVDTVLSGMFPDYNFDIEFKASDYITDTDDGRYTVSFSVLINGLNPENPDDQTAALVSGDIHVDSNTNAISIEYSRTLDNAMLNTN